MNKAIYRDSSFLDRRSEGAGKIAGSVPIDSIEDMIVALPPRRIHFIMHIAFALSTLLARCLEELTDELVLKEPLALTNMADFQPGYDNDFQPPENMMSDATWRRVVEFILLLYGRHYPGQSGVVIKAHDRVFPLTDLLLERDEATRVVYFYLDERQFAHSLLRNSNRRAWARGNLSRSLQTDPYPSRLPEMATLSDAQCAILLWLGRMNRLRRLTERYGADRILAMNGARLSEDPKATLSKVVHFFGFPTDPSRLETVVHGPIFRRYAKNQNQEFTPESRRKLTRELDNRFGGEIDEAVKWAKDLQPPEGGRVPSPARENYSRP